jgi:endo-1,4-beta-xylanase
MAVPATPAALQLQAQHYADVVAACLEVPACDMVVLWGFTDLASWIPGFFPGQGDALPFDAAFQPKPAYTALNELLARW